MRTIGIYVRTGPSRQHPAERRRKPVLAGLDPLLLVCVSWAVIITAVAIAVVTLLFPV